MGLIPEEIIAQVLDRCDIVETIAGYIPLKRAGRSFKANCPFHNEKTPSFVVNPGKQIFHCFGCGVGGNVITFVMKQERLEFPEALRMLANKVGIDIPENNSADPQTVSLKDLLYKTNDLAVQFFHDTLLAGKDATALEARKYLQNRGINLETVKKFRLGFACDKWDSLLSFLRSKDVSLNAIEKAGLIVPKENRDGYYDRFRYRVIFPIFDIKSRCMAFGARALQKEISAKYINSPETLLYTKGNHLYGLHLSRNAVQEKDFAIVVEGYMDFIIPYQAGIDNIVASLGTSLTVEQIRLLRRHTKNVVMLFDADKAGESAMVRSLDILIEEGMNAKVASLAEGEDPDSFIRKFGAEEFQKRIDEALSLFDYKMKILTGRFSHKTPEGKAQIASEMLPTIDKFENSVLKLSYLKRLAEILSVPEEALLIELQKLPSSTVVREEVFKKAAPAAMNERTVERNLLRLMLEEESFISLTKEELEITDFQDEIIKNIVAQMFQFLEEGKEVSVNSLMSSFNDQIILQTISQLLTSEEPFLGDKERIRRDYINRIKTDRMRIQRELLRVQIKEAEHSGDKNRLEELTRKFNQSIK